MHYCKPYSIIRNCRSVCLNRNKLLNVKLLKSVWTQPLLLWWWLLGSWCKCCILFAKIISALFLLLLLKKYFQQSFVLFLHEISIEFERIYHTPGSKFSGKIWNYCEWNSRPMELAPFISVFGRCCWFYACFRQKYQIQSEQKYQIIRWIIRFFNCLMYILNISTEETSLISLPWYMSDPGFQGNNTVVTIHYQLLGDTNQHHRF